MKSFKNIDTRVKLVGGEIRFNFDGYNLEKWLQRKNNFETKVKDLSQPFERFGLYMLKSTDRNFQAEGRPKKWTPLAPSTIRERIRLGYGSGPILQRTGTLRRGFRIHVGKTFLRVLNNTPYFQFHQQDKKTGKQLPRRQMLILLNQDKAQFTRIANDYLELQ